VAQQSDAVGGEFRRQCGTANLIQPDARPRDFSEPTIKHSLYSSAKAPLTLSSRTTHHIVVFGDSSSQNVFLTKEKHQQSAMKTEFIATGILLLAAVVVAVPVPDRHPGGSLQDAIDRAVSAIVTATPVAEHFLEPSDLKKVIDRALSAAYGMTESQVTQGSKNSLLYDTVVNRYWRCLVREIAGNSQIGVINIKFGDQAKDVKIFLPEMGALGDIMGFEPGKRGDGINVEAAKGNSFTVEAENGDEGRREYHFEVWIDRLWRLRWTEIGPWNGWKLWENTRQVGPSKGIGIVEHLQSFMISTLGREFASLPFGRPIIEVVIAHQPGSARDLAGFTHPNLQTVSPIWRNFEEILRQPLQTSFKSILPSVIPP
jgi:hypothetical protein